MSFTGRTLLTGGPHLLIRATPSVAAGHVLAAVKGVDRLPGPRSGGLTVDSAGRS